jgi:WD40 repeat protein
MDNGVVAILRSNRPVGSGVRVAGGLILTSHHVVAGASAEEFFLIQSGLRKSEVRVVATDETLDLALLEISAGADETNSILSFDLAPIAHSDPIRIVGFPFGRPDQVVELSGIVAGLAIKTEGDVHFGLQQMSLGSTFEKEGMSGGAVLRKMMLIGIVQAEIAAEQTNICWFTPVERILTNKSSYLTQILESRLYYDLDGDSVTSYMATQGYTKCEEIDNIFTFVGTQPFYIKCRVGFRRDHIVILKSYPSNDCKQILFLPANQVLLVKGDCDEAEITVIPWEPLSAIKVETRRFAQQIVTIMEAANRGDRSGENSSLFKQLQLSQYADAEEMQLSGLTANSTRTGFAQFSAEWLSRPNADTLLLIGSFGCGKTALLVSMMADFARRRLADGDAYPALIYLDLNGLDNNFNFPDFSVQYMKTAGLSVSTWEEARAFLIRHNGLLAIDGVEALSGRAITNRTLAENLEQLVRDHLSGIRVVMAARQEAFQSEEEFVSLRSPAMVLGAERRRAIEVKTIELPPSDAVHAIIQKRFGPQKSSVCLAVMREVHDLMDLGRRPVFLELLMELFENSKDLGSSTEDDGKKIYDELISRWILHERGRSNINEDLLLLVATELWMASNHEMAFGELLENVKLTAANNSRLVQASLQKDLMLSCLLRRTGEGSKVRFAHESILHYLVARGVSSELRDPLKQKLLKTLLPGEILEFLRQFSPAVESLYELVSTGTGTDALSRNAATLLAMLAPHRSLTEINWANAKLAGADLSGADLSGSILSGADLRSVMFTRTKLDETDLTNADLSDASFADMTSVRALCYNSRGTLIACGGTGGAVLIWGVRHGRLTQVIRSAELSGEVLSMDWSSDMRVLAIASTSGLLIWDIERRSPMQIVNEPVGTTAVAFCKSSGRLAVGTASGSVHPARVHDACITFDSSDGGAHSGTIQHLAWSPSGKVLCSGGIDGKVLGWTEKSNLLSMETELFRHVDYVRQVQWSYDDKVASVGDDGTIAIQSWPFGRRKTQLANFDSEVLSASWHPYRPLLAVGLRDDSVRLVDTATDEPQTLAPQARTHTGRVWAASWSPDGRFLATGGNEGRIIFWSLDEKNTQLRVSLELDTTFSCRDAKLAGAKGLDAPGYFVALHKDRPWEIRSASLGEWLLSKRARGFDPK